MLSHQQIFFNRYLHETVSVLVWCVLSHPGMSEKNRSSAQQSVLKKIIIQLLFRRSFLSLHKVRKKVNRQREHNRGVLLCGNCVQSLWTTTRAKLSKCLISEVLTSKNIKNVVFWVVILCILVDRYLHVGETC